MKYSCDNCHKTSDQGYIMDKSDVNEWPDGYESLCEKCYDEMSGPFNIVE